MALGLGVRFGPYEVADRIGVGGMGEVYRAIDTNLKRDVAVKVLPEAFAADADRLARFRQEAEVLASLNHPNIAHIYGLEQAGDQTVIVMELVDGPTLADRIAEGPLPANEALDAARQIAAALEAAHGQRIVHRDLKPANIKLRPDGTVKVLDFGIAKDIGARAISGDGSELDTPPATQTGLLLGTAAYMSPEQARGRPVDQRTDIWAFGCLLYEMLTGQPAFGGEDATVTLARVIEREANLGSMSGTVSPAVRHAIAMCLQKDVSRRIADIRDVKLAIEGEFWPTSGVGSSKPARPSKVAAAAVLLITAGVAAAVTWILKPDAPAVDNAVTRSLLAIRPFDRTGLDGSVISGEPVTRPEFSAIALSPDGRTLVFRATGSNGAQLFRRPLDSLDATPIAGTERAENPFFSPDGNWIGFSADGELRRVPADGGPSGLIVAVPGARPEVVSGASWGDDDVIVFSTISGLWRVDASGTGLAQITEPSDEEGVQHRHPYLLPGGEAILYTVQKAFFRWTDSDIVVRSLTSEEQRVLVGNGAADARYVPTGHIVFTRRGQLTAVPFDLDSLTLAGDEVPLIDDVMQSVNTGGAYQESGVAQAAIGDQGTLVYATGGIAPDSERMLVWVDRNDATPVPLPIEPREFAASRTSPDGRTLLVYTPVTRSGEMHRIWIWDGRALQAVTGPNERGELPIWSPDYERIIYSTTETGDIQLHSRPADRSGEPVRLATSDYTQVASDVCTTRENRSLLVFAEVGSDTGNDIWTLDLDTENAEPAMFKPGAWQPAFSRDCRFLAYTSGPEGATEIFVEPFPGPGPRVQISTDGGDSPAWRADGRELYYIKRLDDGGIRMMTVEVRMMDAGTIEPGSPEALFEGPYLAFTRPVRSYDVTPDGQQFLLVQPLDPEPEPATELIVVQNWFEELERVEVAR